MVPDRTHLSKLNPVKLLTFVFEVVKEQGYIDEEGFLTPLGGQYLSVMADVPPGAGSTQVAETVTLEANTVRELTGRLNVYHQRLVDVNRSAPANLGEIDDEDFRWALQAVRDELTPYDERPGDVRA